MAMAMAVVVDGHGHGHGRWPRLGECNWKAAWSLLVESAVREVSAWIADQRAEGEMEAAEYMQQKLEHLQKRIDLLKGAPNVEDCMKEFVKIERQFKSGAVELPPEERVEAVEFSVGCGYLSRDLKVKDDE